jgi:hypothetical protein
MGKKWRKQEIHVEFFYRKSLVRLRCLREDNFRLDIVMMMNLYLQVPLLPQDVHI